MNDSNINYYDDDNDPKRLLQRSDIKDQSYMNSALER